MFYLLIEGVSLFQEMQTSLFINAANHIYQYYVNKN